jgi:MYXO-CTERM domain-containing protein
VQARNDSLAPLCPCTARALAAASLASAALWLAAAAPAATLYDEAVSGDLTADEVTAPLVGTLAEGENSVLGTMSDVGDAFRVELGPGLEITDASVVVSNFTGQFTSGRARLSTTAGGDIDQFNFDADGTYPFLGPPLPSDTYLFKLFLIGESIPTYDWEVRITVPEPDGSGFALALLVAGALVRRRWDSGRR